MTLRTALWQPATNALGNALITRLCWALLLATCQRQTSASRQAAVAVPIATSTTNRPPSPEPIPLRERPVPWHAAPTLRTIRGAWENARATDYTSIPRVDEAAGRYDFDCSGFADWVLRRSTPAAANWVGAGLPHRPLARDFHSRISRIDEALPRHGWRRVRRVSDIRPGDVVAWVKPREVQSANTGHVVFALLPPEPIERGSNTYWVRVADATRLWHSADTRDWRQAAPVRRSPLGQDTRDESVNDKGLGFGSITLVADPKTGEPVEYGWVGVEWRTFPTAIAIGRPER